MDTCVNDCLQCERRVAQDKLDELYQSHFQESQSVKQDSYDLKQRLLEWENKADDMEVRLAQSSNDKTMQEDYQRQPESPQVTIEGLERHIKQMHTQAMERQEESAKIVYSGKLNSKQ